MDGIASSNNLLLLMAANGEKRKQRKTARATFESSCYLLVRLLPHKSRYDSLAKTLIVIHNL